MDRERSDPDRPDPDVLLARLKREEKGTRGRLRIYLGMAPGVGKTYAMLNEAHRRTERKSADIVVGYVETYNRPNTVKVLEGLEVVPRKKITHRGVTIEEMDVDAIIARKPTVALVDELAHTNAPGSKHEKRWQDVEELRDHGVTVISTMNIQHLESVNDLVENITGVKVRETVPDRIVDEADEIELVDISPEALRSRMRHGNIYPPAQAEAALENFFKVEHLAALRQLALRRTAQEVEQQIEQYMHDFHREGLQTAERVLVTVTEQQQSKAIMRRGWRIASALHAELLAVHVDCGRRLNDNERLNLESHLRLAEDLGAQVVRLSGRDVATAIAQYCRQEHVTQVVVGHSHHSRLEELLRGSVVNRLLRLLPDVDIHVIAERPEQRVAGSG
ncbi:MAG: universal stress protein [Chloroflexi bacterium]|nr:universal stress protein [Chloroflexota bacterium]